MADKSAPHLLLRIQELERRLEESEQLIEAIKAGEVDAFAIKNENESEIYTLQSGDYAYRVLIEEFGEGAINVTEEGLIVYSNPYFYNLLKLPYEKVIGSSVFNFIHADSLKEFNLLFSNSLKGKSKGEIKLAVNDTVIPVYVSLTSLRPNLATIGIVITDLAEKKENEKIILEYQKDLELKNRELVQGNEELSSFTYIASHDLQEPLRKIQTFATLILEKEHMNLSENGKDHFNRMFRAAKRMQTLIDDLLTYSRSNTMERKFEKVSLRKIVDEVKADFKEELVDKNATIGIDEMCEVKVIPFQFRQLIQNLVGNSLKFSNSQQPLCIKIKSEIVSGENVQLERISRDKKYCHISVSDNGIGFEQQYSEKIFELFQQLNNRHDGTGIGLAIVKKIVQNHHGIITATSEPGEGATFDIYLPEI
jgi:PAS domain S-box-containing protein